MDKWRGTIQYDTTTEISYQKLISIYKYPQTTEISYSFDFKDFYSSADLGLQHADTTVNGKLIKDYNIIKHNYPERITDSSNIEFIYWTDKDGLIAYKNKHGDWWTKISSQNAANCCGKTF